jgi:hypothetical protein
LEVYAASRLVCIENSLDIDGTGPIVAAQGEIEICGRLPQDFMAVINIT